MHIIQTDIILFAILLLGAIILNKDFIRSEFLSQEDEE